MEKFMEPVKPDTSKYYQAHVMPAPRQRPNECAKTRISAAFFIKTMLFFFLDSNCYTVQVWLITVSGYKYVFI